MEWHLGLSERKTAWAGQRKGTSTQVSAADLSKSSLNAFYIWPMACHIALNDCSFWPSPSECGAMCEHASCNSTINRDLNFQMQS